MPARKIGILGSGTVGQQLATGLARHGFDVKVGSREPGKLAEWKAKTPGIVSTGSPAEAAQHGDVVILATRGDVTESAIDLAGPAHFRGKLVLDATNPLDFSKGMPPGLFVGTTDSLGERVQRRLPGAHVVKCFNTVSNTQMIDPRFAEGVPPMMVCGNDAEAKQRAAALLRELGWPGTLDLGDITAARWLEANVPLWVRAGQALGTFGHMFKAVT